VLIHDPLDSPTTLLNAKPGDEDLLTEIQGIESLQKPLFDEVVTYFLELGWWIGCRSVVILSCKSNE
jgi:hypothetical protein